MTMTIRMCVIPAALGLLAGAAARGEETLEAIQKRLDAVAEKVSSLSFSMESRAETEENGGKQRSMIKVDWLRKGKVQLFKTEATVETTAGSEKSESKMTSVSDGETFTVLQDGPEGKIAIKYKGNEEMAVIPWAAQALSSLKDGNELKVLPGEKVEGREVSVIEATAKEASVPPGRPKKIKMWIDSANGLVTHQHATDADGKTVFDVTVKDVKLNAKFSDDHFTLKIPDGVQVMDLTKMGAEEPKK